MKTLAPVSKELEAELLRALSNSEFVLYYQPQYNLVTSVFEGVEALIRWQHPKRGLVLPDDFIGTAENSDIIIAIGEWTVRTACQQFKVWQDKKLSPLRIAVNISGRQIKQKKFVDFVVHALNEFNLDPGCLELELNENIIIQEDDQQIIEIIQHLNKIGVLIALDDFGTGRSTPDYLKRIPVDRIKIAKIHIDNIHLNNDEVKSLIKLATEFNVSLVAEGVETHKQLQMLLDQWRMEVQGNYFSAPLPSGEMEIFLVTNRNK
jgi:EAL domain-containing protein (putative c-di-GMP-specific phosphodiesterase class I)